MGKYGYFTVMDAEERQKRRHPLIRKIRNIVFVVALVSAIMIASLVGTYIFMPAYRPLIAQLPQRTQFLTNFAIREIERPLLHVVVTGNKITATNSIVQALNVKEGQSLWFFSSRKAYAAIRDLPLIETAKIEERDDISTIFVSVTERAPIAMWQRQGKISLINESGNPISLPQNIQNSGITLTADLPFVVGDEGNAHIKDLLDALNNRLPVASYNFIGGRRWNLNLKNGTYIMLPENGWRETLERFLALDRKIRVTAAAPHRVDLRTDGQMTLTALSPASKG